MWHWLAGLPWAGIGTAIAAVTGTGALGVAVLERRARVKAEYSAFDIKRIGTTSDAGDGEPAEVFEFWHQGTVMATISSGLLLYGASALLTEDRRVPAVMTPGQRVLLNLRSDDFNSAFAVIIWADSRRKKPAQMRWLPLEILSPLGEELARQVHRQRWIAVRSRLPLGTPLVVGPGGTCRLWLPAKPSAIAARIPRLLPGRPTSTA